MDWNEVIAQAGTVRITIEIPGAKLASLGKFIPDKIAVEATSEATAGEEDLDVLELEEEELAPRRLYVGLSPDAATAERFVEEGVFAVDFFKEPAQGEQTIRKLKRGDELVLHVSGAGMKAYGTVTEEFTERQSQPVLHVGDPTHGPDRYTYRVKVDWAAVLPTDQAIPAHRLKELDIPNIFRRTLVYVPSKYYPGFRRAFNLLAAKTGSSRPPCLCGCGEVPLRRSSIFVPGHDGRLKGRIIRHLRGEETKPITQEQMDYARANWNLSVAGQ